MFTPGSGENSDRVQRLVQPPFIINSWAGLAFVEGKYNPPSAKVIEPVPDDFLGIYVSREDPGFALFTFTGCGEYRAFHRCGTPDATAEFALIDAFINYEIPFEQWRTYPIGAAEAQMLDQMGLEQPHEMAMKGLTAVLYRARLNVRPRRPKLPPMFLLSARSSQSIQDDEDTEIAIWRSLLGEEAAARHIRNLAMSRQQASQRDAGENDANAP
jgi:hypothetical protein